MKTQIHSKNRVMVRRRIMRRFLVATEYAMMAEAGVFKIDDCADLYIMEHWEAPD